MPLFKKKPSIQQKRAALGLIPGTPVPFDEYAHVLRNAFHAAVLYREPPDIAEEMGIGATILPHQGPAFLAMIMNEYSPLYGAVSHLQDKQPDIPELLDVHVAAVSYLEQFIMAAERYNVSLQLDLQGDEREAAKMYAEAQQRNAQVIKARNLLAAEMRQLNRNNRALYAALAIPDEHLIRLGLI